MTKYRFVSTPSSRQKEITDPIEIGRWKMHFYSEQQEAMSSHVQPMTMEERIRMIEDARAREFRPDRQVLVLDDS